MDKVNSCIEKLNLEKPKSEKYFTKKENLIEKCILRLPKHIDTFIDDIKKMVMIIFLKYNSYIMLYH